MSDPDQRDDLEQRIGVDDAVRFGRPAIRGTRVTANGVVGLIAAGMDRDAVAEEYGIEVADVNAALRYAANAVANERRWAQ
ncbi:MAG: DUF433 domain-containing protein [bacterium]|nr:DUF433 domain-containing protein [bacterium]